MSAHQGRAPATEDSAMSVATPSNQRGGTAWRLPLLCISLACTGCAVVAVADAAITVAATTVKVGATVVGAAVDVGAAGVRAVAGSDDE
jgi:hypothetical protein